MRILLPSKPGKIALKHQDAAEPAEHTWDAQTSTLLLKFRNYAEGVEVTISL